MFWKIVIFKKIRKIRRNKHFLRNSFLVELWKYSSRASRDQCFRLFHTSKGHAMQNITFIQKILRGISKHSCSVNFENTAVTVSSLTKSDLHDGLFLVIFWKFQNSYFMEHLWVAAFMLPTLLFKVRGIHLPVES